MQWFTEGSAQKKDSRSSPRAFVAAKAWSGRRDSNPRPSPWQGDALPLSHFRQCQSRRRRRPRTVDIPTRGGGEGETRTLTDLRPHDPKSCSSTNSDTSPGSVLRFPVRSGGLGRAEKPDPSFPESKLYGAASNRVKVSDGADQPGALLHRSLPRTDTRGPVAPAPRFRRRRSGRRAQPAKFRAAASQLITLNQAAT